MDFWVLFIWLSFCKLYKRCVHLQKEASDQARARRFHVFRFDMKDKDFYSSTWAV